MLIYLAIPINIAQQKRADNRGDCPRNFKKINNMEILEATHIDMVDERKASQRFLIDDANILRNIETTKKNLENLYLEV